MTNPDLKWQTKNSKPVSAPQKENDEEENEFEDIVDPHEKNVELLKVKIYYMAKKQKNLQNKFAKSIVEDSKVFHKRFEMI